MDACATDLKEKLMKLFDILYLTPRVSLTVCVCACACACTCVCVCACMCVCVWCVCVCGVCGVRCMCVCVCVCVWLAIIVKLTLSLLQKKEYNEMTVVSKLVRHFSSFNKDYSDFLSLKGEVNIPMVRYPLIKCLCVCARCKYICPRLCAYMCVWLYACVYWI